VTDAGDARDAAGGPLDDGPPLAPSVVESPLVECWRCGLKVHAAAGVCPHCRAPGLGGAPMTIPSAAAPPPLVKVFVGYAGMFVLSLIWGWILHAGPRQSDEFLDAGTAVFESVDTVITLAVWAWIGRLRTPAPGWQLRITAWLAAPVALGLVMAVNVGYRAVVEQFVHGEWLRDLDRTPDWSLFNVLLWAVQPAIVEELFFRYLAYGAVRAVSGVHTAVWVSAVMFAVAHIYNPLGLPWLLVCGVVLGYFRAGGGVALPMLMHFAHNLVMVWYWS